MFREPSETIRDGKPRAGSYVTSSTAECFAIPRSMKSNSDSIVGHEARVERLAIRDLRRVDDRVVDDHDAHGPDDRRRSRLG